MYWSIVQRLDHDTKVPSELKKKDLTFHKGRIQVQYLWDPHLNGSSLIAHVENYHRGIKGRPLLTVVGAGNWYASRGKVDEHTSAVKGLAANPYSNTSLQTLSVGSGDAFTYKDGPGDLLLFVPAEEPFIANQSRSEPTPYQKLNANLEALAAENDIELISSFTEMLRGKGDLYKDKGTRTKHKVSQRRVDILLNLRCNANIGAKGRFPNKATCCGVWRGPNLFQRVFLVLGLAVLPTIVVMDFRVPFVSDPARPVMRALSAFTAAISLQYLADRTHVYEQVARLPLVKSNLVRYRRMQ